MLRLMINDYDHGKTYRLFGDAQEIARHLVSRFPQTTDPSMTVDEMVLAINEQAIYTVRLDSLDDSAPLPEGYWNRDQGDDPWKRESDK